MSVRSLTLTLTVLVACQLASLPVALAQPVPVGPAFQVNTYTQGFKTTPAVAAGDAGNFLVIWSSDGQEGWGSGVYGQRYTSGGAVAGGEFLMNTFTPESQINPAVAADAAGSFVAVWESGSIGGTNVAGQLYTSAGMPVGTEFQVNTYTGGFHRWPAVASDANGNFVVVWQQVPVTGPPYPSDVFARLYTSDGTPVGSDFLVNTDTTGLHTEPAVASDDAGNFVVVWTVDTEIFGQRFTGAGTPVGGEFQVNSYTTGSQYEPAVASDGAGKFVVVWTSVTVSGFDSVWEVLGQRYTSAGTPDGGEFEVSTYSYDQQIQPAVAADADGDVVVVWTQSNGFGGVITGQRYTSGGSADGGHFSVSAVGSVSFPTIAADAGGDFTVAWAADSELSIFARRYLPIGATTTTLPGATTTTTLPLVTGCGPTPAGGCVTGAKASFQLKDDPDDTKDQLKWKLSRGGAFDQMALGDPATARAYTLCIYDETGGSPSLVGTIQIDPNTSWVDKDPKGLSYVDKTGAEDGVTKASLRAGDAGKTGASVSAKGTNIPMATPTSGTEYFNQDTALTVQLVNNETATCWTSEFATAIKNDGVQFKAKTP